MLENLLCGQLKLPYRYIYIVLGYYILNFSI